jgi:hypothetical protein
MSGTWHRGNAVEDGIATHGWILGHFVEPIGDVRHSENVEVKWGIHPAGDKRAGWTEGDHRTTLVLHVSGRFRVDLTSGSFTLEHQGDYLAWGPDIDHSWEAITDAVVVTVRWPSAASGEAILRRACRAAGLSADGARLLRLGSNAVYGLPGNVIARIAGPATDATAARRAIGVARWLASARFPAVRALDVEQPVVIDSRPATFWESLPGTGDEYGSTGQLASLVARLHKLVPPKDLCLPVLDPFAGMEERIAASASLTRSERAWMTTELAKHRASYARLDFALPKGVIHGDASVGNVLRGNRGEPTLSDLDDFATGPREWDLVQTALYYDRLGWHTRDEYETFTSAYGYDIMHWPGYPVLANIREFLLVTWIIAKADKDGRTVAEARKRLNALRTGASRKDWTPF